MPKAKTSTAATPAPAPTTGAGPAPAMIAGFAGLPPGVPPPLIPSSHPSQAVSVGLANNFNGRVMSLWYVPRLVEKKLRGQGGKIKLYELFVELTIQADDHSLGRNADGIVIEYMKADQLSQWVPSRTDPVFNPQTQQWMYTPAGTVAGQPATLDIYMQLANGQNGFPSAEVDPATGQAKWALVAPDDWKGFIIVPGKALNRTSIMKGTKWIQFTTELDKQGYATKAPHIPWSDFRKFLVGVYGTWKRLPFQFEGGHSPEDRQGENVIETLCLTQILDLGPISGASGPQPQAQAPAVVAPAVAAASVPAPMPAPATVSPAAVSAPAPVAQPEPQTVATSPLGGKDPALVSAAANEILTALVAQWVAGGSNPAAAVTKTLAGTAVYEGLNAKGLDAGLGLRFVNDTEWMEADERGFAYDASKGMLLPL